MSITLYNQYIYKNGNWYLVGSSSEGAEPVTYALSGSGDTVTLTGSDSSTSSATISGFLTTETDPTVPSWAKASSKPSYTSSEVGAIADPSTKSSGQFLKYNGSAWVADNVPSAPVTSVNSKTGAVTLSASDVGALPSDTTIPQGTVTSVRVQATSPVSSSTSTAQSTTLNTTISLANAYGDTKNPYGTKTANYVLAGPTSGSAAAPSFRALVAADIPPITKSKISDFPTAVSSFTNDAGYLTSFTETDPTVPSWAKASSKPTYTASEVGALADTTDVTKWGDVALDKTSGVGGTGFKVIVLASASATTAYLLGSGYTPTAGYLATYNNDKYLFSTTPSASDNSTKVATTAYVDNAVSSVDALPSQSGQSGKFLTTNGSAASWATVTIPSVEAMSTSDIDTAIAASQ